MEGLVGLAVVLAIGKLGVGRCVEVLAVEDRRGFAARCGEGLEVVGLSFGEEVLRLRLRQVGVVGRRESETGSEVRRG